MKSLESVLRDPAVQIEEIGGLSRKAVAGIPSPPTPFVVELRPDSLELTFPAFCSLYIEEGWHWKLVHSGKHWGERGIQARTERLTLGFPLQSKLKISAQGKTWQIQLRPRTLQPIRPDLKNAVRNTRFFGLSLLVHANLILFFWLAVQYHFGLGLSPQSTPTPKNEPEVKVSENKPAAGSSGEVVMSRPFEGISYTDFMRRVDRAQQEADPLGYLAKSLGKSSLGPSSGNGSARVAGVQSATGGLNTGGNGMGNRLTHAVSNQQFSVQANTDKSEKISEQRRIALREKFRDIQDDFKRIYSKLLVQDPALSVTVAYSARVTPSGYLELADFKARGTYQPDSLPRLKSEMAEIIHGVYIGPELSGIVLRAENVFMR